MSCSIRAVLDSFHVALLLHDTPLLLEGARQKGGAAGGRSERVARAPARFPSTPKTDRATAGGELIGLEEVVALRVGTVVMEETVNCKQVRGAYVGVQSIGIRGSPHLCGTFVAHASFTPTSSLLSCLSLTESPITTCLSDGHVDPLQSFVIILTL
jgi:hypothetical protein